MANQYQQYLSDAKIAYASKRYKTAITICDKLIGFKMNDLLPYKIKGNSLILLNKYKEAQSVFEEALKINDQDGESFYFLGNTYFALKDYSTALKNYALADKLGVNDSIRHQMYSQMGVINSADGQNAQAIKNYEKANQISGNYKDRTEILCNKLQLYVVERDWENAEACAREYKMLNPVDFYGYQVLFQMLLQQGKIKEAGGVLDEAENVFFSDEQKIELVFDRVMYDVAMAKQKNANAYYAKAIMEFDKLNDLNLPLDVSTEIKVTKAELNMQLKCVRTAATLFEEVVNQKYDVQKDYTEYIQRAAYFLTRIYREAGYYAKMLLHAQRLLDISEKYLKNANQIILSKESSDPEKKQAILLKNQGMRNKFQALYMIANAKKGLAEKKGESMDSALDGYQYLISYTRECSSAADVELAISIEARMYRAKAYKDLGKMDEVEKVRAGLPEESSSSLDEFLNS